MNAPPQEKQESGVLRSMLMIGGFAIAMIGGGHGVGPIGLLLVYGSYSAWGPAIVLAWSSIIAVFILHTSRRFKYKSSALTLCYVSLYVSWLLFCQLSMESSSHSYETSYLNALLGLGVLSAPFQIVFWFSMWNSFKQWKLARLSQ
jgi:hypothetical protein